MNKLVDLTRCAIIGKLDEGTDLLNYFILLPRLHIWVSRKPNVHPDLNLFKRIVKAKFRTEKYIASKKYGRKISG